MVEEWEKWRGDELRSVLQKLCIHPSIEQITCSLEQRSIQELSQLLLLLGKDKAQAVARDIIQVFNSSDLNVTESGDARC